MAHHYKTHPSVSGSAAVDYSDPRVYPEPDPHVTSWHIEHLYRRSDLQGKSVRVHVSRFAVQRMGGHAGHVVGLSLDLLSVDRFYTDRIDYAADYSSERDARQPGAPVGGGAAGADGKGFE